MSAPIIGAMATRTATLSLLIPSAAAEIQLLPAGLFRAADGSGRPAGLDGWYIDAEIAGRLIMQAAARQTKFVIDYEHQTFLAEKNGQPAPAAGWFDGRGLEWREGIGLFATQVEWTERARNMIRDGEYRYLSPAFTWDDTNGAVKLLVNAGLTNNPGLDGMAAVALSAYIQQSQPEETPVNETLKKLLAAIGLPAETDEAAALTAVAALKAKADQAGGLEAQVATLTAKAGAAPDPARYVPIETYTAVQGQLATLSAQVETTERQGLIDAGLADGRLNPAAVEWAKSLPVAQLRGFLEVAAPVAALKGMQSQGKDPGKQSQGAGSLTASELAVCRAMGLSADEFAKAKEA